MLVRSYSGIIGTMGQEERVRTATKESGESVSEGNVAENMTVPRKAIGKSSRLQSHDCDNVGLHGNGHTFRFTNHNSRKGVAERRRLTLKCWAILHEPGLTTLFRLYLVK